MLGQVDRRRLVGDGAVVEDKLVARGQGVGNFDTQRPRIALLARGAGVGEHQPGTGVVCERLGPPQDLVEADDATVQVVGPVIGRQLVLLAIEPESPARNAIAVAADQGPEIRAVDEIPIEHLVPEHHVGKMPFPIRDSKRYDDAPIVDRGDLDAGPVGERERGHLLAPRQGPEPDGTDACCRLGRGGRAGRLTCRDCGQHRHCQQGQPPSLAPTVWAERIASSPLGSVVHLAFRCRFCLARALGTVRSTLAAVPATGPCAS